MSSKEVYVDIETDKKTGAFTWIFFFKQKTAYEMRISDWSSDVCSSDLAAAHQRESQHPVALGATGGGDQQPDRHVDADQHPRGERRIGRTGAAVRRLVLLGLLRSLVHARRALEADRGGHHAVGADGAIADRKSVV